MSTASSQREMELQLAILTASKNGEVSHVRRLLDQKTNPSCADSVSKFNFSYGNLSIMLLFHEVNERSFRKIYIVQYLCHGVRSC